MPARLSLSRMVKQVSSISNPSRDYVEACIGWLDSHLWLFDLVGSAKRERLLDVFDYAYRRYGVKYFVVDSLLKCGIAEEDLTTQKNFVDQLCDFKNRRDVHIFLVAHSRKTQDESNPPGKMDIRGSSAITDLADNVLSIWRNKGKEQVSPDEQSIPDGSLLCHKQRNGSWEGKAPMWYSRQSYQYLRNPEERPKRYVHWP